MSTFLSHAQTADLRSRVTRALAPGKRGTHGSATAALTASESRTFEVVLDCLNDMKRDGKL